MKVNISSFIFFFDSESIKEQDFINMLVKNTWFQKHKAFHYEGNKILDGLFLAHNFLVATNYVAREPDTNFIRMVIDRNGNENAPV